MTRHAGGRPSAATGRHTHLPFYNTTKNSITNDNPHKI